ncbi:MAG: NADH:ubiquinone reductase (Na(+)-transporting) subunit E [Phycisphaerae bacterium]|jgi:Na+-transporting NADH:ubiquinone oxidoreductase subunit E|nr:NADH:ubiquinone reductase (Na(+)-transporting) subunit E [Phycisphaerae bacterium]NIR66863.1 NADH:ubiquinone reductase (Na(+)-transporting) subunit E [candidate division Zixibacteria bacterium]NIP51281.1 NADH:ubiquinone reductase (Na(+)-transporting) subunit E [Phycisphaerae bacterium]NIS54018.1 NADH:ubiquinone reductase (Na(+)-transporting) subunit E [Phycisphaerae bacterium]NIU11626.1 NADH:ubiquinone reductase (Na(+)-transporting) subunit E [Phycisphaerae bacterium]
MSETTAFVIFIAAIFTNNILLTNFLGLCSFIACSGQIRTSLGLGTAVTFVMIMTTAINYAVYYGILISAEEAAELGRAAPLISADLTHLQFIVFIAVIAAFVQLVEMFVERFSPRLYFALGIFLPLITVNCSILGASLFMIIRKYSFIQSVGFGLGAGLGWAVAIVLLAGLRQKMRYSNIPEPFQGVPIAMVVTGVLAMAFMGFAGMVSIQ